MRYDHTIPWWIAPHLDDDGPNVKAVRTECDAPKTYGRDIPMIAKTKRQMAMSLDVPRPPPKMRGGGKLQGRGFEKGHRPLRSRNNLRKRP